ncbi:MAG: hypothetical protein ABIF09_00895 [Gemmatimonadota bacterium]
MIPRTAAFHRIREAIRVHPVVALLSPRQAGKTTLARQYTRDDSVTWFVDRPRHWPDALAS